MGQYFHPVILAKDKKTVLKWMYSHEYNDGLKLMEHSYLENEFVGAFESLLVRNPQHVVWAGDYADPEYTEKQTRLETEYEFKKRQEKNVGKYLRPKKVTENVDVTIYSLCDDSSKVNPKAGKVKERYIVNHDKKQFIDKKKVPATDYYYEAETDKIWTYKIHPLPLMTCEGNDRGGGDFHVNPDKEQGCTSLIGTWARDLISVESEVPEGYTEIIFNLTENGIAVRPKKPAKKEYTVEVTRYYVVTDHITVTAEDEDDAKEQAAIISDNKDYTGNLDLDHVTTEIV